MGTGQDFRQSDEQLIIASLAKIIKVKDGKLYLGKKQIKITLPGKPGDPGITPRKGIDYRDGIDGIGKPPKHQWDGTKIRFQNPNNSWGRWVDLKGEKGNPGITPKKDVDYRDGEPGEDGIGNPPVHQWQGTKIRFQNPDKTWGEWIDLRGAKGDKLKGEKGDMPKHEWRGTLLRIQNPDGSWSKWVDLRGKPGIGKPGKTPRKGIDYKDGGKGDKGDKAVLPKAEEILILKDVNQVVGETGKVALEKQFQPIKVLKV